ncbi:Hypothetical_protein [Hexamita inflata]|uniref:Hypothetical_protein n=1 Tax=Hexamita inflata TaxID=28002 RepID=A0AA86R1M9_9EUKA|nr:Hypothetical protein HINF_LOCUS52192 [Hexamita inflata]
MAITPKVIQEKDEISNSYRINIIQYSDTIDEMKYSMRKYIITEELQNIIAEIQTNTVQDENIQSKIEYLFHQIANLENQEQSSANIDIEIHNLLNINCERLNNNQQYFNLVLRLAAQKIDHGDNISLEDLLLSLKIAISNHARDEIVKSICKAIKMKNPADVVSFLNQQFNELQPFTNKTTAIEFQKQLKIVCGNILYIYKQNNSIATIQKRFLIMEKCII